MEVESIFDLVPFNQKPKNVFLILMDDLRLIEISTTDIENPSSKTVK